MKRWCAALLLSAAASATHAAPAVHGEPARAGSLPQHTFVEHLLELAKRAHPELVSLTAYATQPEGKSVVLAGSTLGRSAQPAGPDELQIIAGGTVKSAVNAAGQLEVKEVLQDVSHDPIGAVDIVFAHRRGQPARAHEATATAIQTEMSRHLISAANAFDPYPYDPKYREDTYAQALVDRTVRAHPEVIILAIHATPPGSSQNVIIGSTIGRIGKKADEDDLRVIDKGETNLEVASNGKRFEVELPLNDARGQRIGALGVVTAYKTGDDKAGLRVRAERIRDEMAREIPQAAALVRTRR